MPRVTAMREDTKSLIDRLAHEAAPVRPLRAPLLRVLTFLGAVGAVMFGAAMLRGGIASAFPHFANPAYGTELFGSFIAGIGAVVAAAMIAIPGRSPNWIYAPVPGLLLWIIGGGLECYDQVADLGYVPISLFASKRCFAFIVSVGIPTAIATFVFLRRNLAVNAARALALAGLGAALLAATLLQFVDAHATNPVDFATHIVAVALLAFLAMLAARFARR